MIITMRLDGQELCLSDVPPTLDAGLELRQELQRPCHYCGQEPVPGSPNYSDELEVVARVERKEDSTEVPVGSLLAAQAIVLLAKSRLIGRVYCEKCLDQHCEVRFASENVNGIECAH